MGVQPGDRVGQYQLQERVGCGGMGEVFAAVDEVTGEEVAIKLLLPEAADDPQRNHRFRQEMKVLQALKHPHIVEVRAYAWPEDGTAYIVMEYLGGPSLRAWLDQQGGRVEPEVALSIAWQIADAMVEAHNKKTIHRDLKPSNILTVGSSRVDLQACKLEYSIVSPK